MPNGAAVRWEPAVLSRCDDSNGCAYYTPVALPNFVTSTKVDDAGMTSWAWGLVAAGGVVALLVGIYLYKEFKPRSFGHRDAIIAMPVEITEPTSRTRNVASVVQV